LLAADAADVPLAFVAVTVNVYAVSFVRPVTVIGDDAPDAVMLPGDDVTVYDVIADPPVAPAVKGTDACAFPDVAVPIVGACGTVVAVIAADAADAADVPYTLDAVTVYVYPVLDCKPVIIIGEDDPVFVYPPGDDVIVYVEPGTVPVVKATDA